MKTVLKSVALSLALGAAMPVAMLAVADAPVYAQKVSPAVGNALKAAQSASSKGQHAVAIQQVGAARAAASSSFEKDQVTKMAAFVFQRAGRLTDAAREMEALGAPASQLAALYLQGGNPGKALEYARKAGNTVLVAQILFQQRNYSASAKAIESAINSAERGGRAVPQDWLQLLMRNKYELKDRAGFTAALQKLVSRYPSPENWKDLLKRVRNSPGLSDAGTNGLFRLMGATGSLTVGSDIGEAARFAIINRTPGEAARLLDAGFKSGALANDPNGSNARLLARARTDAAAAAAGVAKAAASARTPDALAQLARNYISMEDYAKAAAALTRATSGGTLKDPDSAFLDLGYAHFKAGNRAKAVEAFRAVKAKPANKEVADLWAIYARQGG
jgi:Tetratricopeptide repeat